MLQNTLSLVGWLLLLLLLQATVFNHIHLLGYATPLPYIYVVMKLPSDTSRVTYILTGFTVGLLVDILSTTPGMAAASLCAVGLVTPLLLTAFMPKDRDEEVLYPSMRSMGRGAFMLYAGSVALLYHALFFLIEAFEVAHPEELLLKWLGSSALTYLIILAFEAIHPKRTAG